MINFLENYLYLLTEDPEMDFLTSELKKAKKEALKYGTGPEGAENLSAKYSNTPKDQIPPAHKAKLDQYRKSVDEIDRISKQRAEYSQWVTNGRVGPKPGTSEFDFAKRAKQAEEAASDRAKSSHNRNTGRGSEWGDDFWKDFNERTQRNYDRHREQRRQAEKEFQETMERLRKNRMAREAKYKRNVIILYVSVFLIWLIALAFESYKKQKMRDKIRANKLKGKEKEIFLLRSTITGLKRQILILEKGKLRCNKTSDPERCKTEIDLRINKLKKRILKSSRDLKNLQNS